MRLRRHKPTRRLPISRLPQMRRRILHKIIPRSWLNVMTPVHDHLALLIRVVVGNYRLAVDGDDLGGLAVVGVGVGSGVDYLLVGAGVLVLGLTVIVHLLAVVHLVGTVRAASAALSTVRVVLTSLRVMHILAIILTVARPLIPVPLITMTRMPALVLMNVNILRIRTVNVNNLRTRRVIRILIVTRACYLN